METRNVIKVIVSRFEQPISLRAGSPDDGQATARDEPVEEEGEGEPMLDHRELDRLLLREARQAADELKKASVALQAASAVVLEAVAALHEERENR